jgi:hypothetical protein
MGMLRNLWPVEASSQEDISNYGIRVSYIEIAQDRTRPGFVRAADGKPGEVMGTGRRVETRHVPKPVSNAQIRASVSPPFALK